jgi:hypothetical protein
VLQQADHHLSHDTAKQSSFQQNIDSQMYQSRYIEITPRRYRNNSSCTWLNSLKFGVDFGVWSAHYAGPRVTLSTTLSAIRSRDTQRVRRTLTLYISYSLASFISQQLRRCVSIYAYSEVACFITDYVTGGYIFALFYRLY